MINFFGISGWLTVMNLSLGCAQGGRAAVAGNPELSVGDMVDN
jgi:hypothetical protein